MTGSPTRPNSNRVTAHGFRLALLYSTLFSSMSAVLVSSPAMAQEAQAIYTFSIPASSLESALVTFTTQTGITVSFAPETVNSLNTKALNGSYSATDALTQLLQGTNLQLSPQINGSYSITTSKNDSITLSTLNIQDTGQSAYQRDETGYDDVYDKNTSTAYMGKIEIERYKGTTPSDLLQGVAGVFSGEARNSGALDVNIRGIQGPGRVPVIIDGTEQSLTVWRGYNGASNRNYIDPNLIGSIQIYKGATNERDVNSGIGGAMVVTTLQPADIIKQGEDFGIELKVEGSSNAIDERVPKLHTGESVYNVPGIPISQTPYSDKTLLVNVKSKSGNDLNPLNGNDYSYRLAVAKKIDKFDFLAAYAYRERGNYFSGKNNADYYASDFTVAYDERDNIRSLAEFWQPGDEVLNTSSKMASWLLKSSWQISDDQKLSLNYRHSDSTYGEIMPSRIALAREKGSIQWPLSEVAAKAYSIDYTYKPSDNPWLDFHSTVWRTDTESDTYTSGGFPNQLRYDKSSFPYLLVDGILVDGAVINSTNTRNGINLSNKMNLSSSLDLTIGGHFQREKQSSDDEYDPNIAKAHPRAGRRQEWDGNFDLAWKTTERLTINGGMKYSSYWAFDDFLDAHPNTFTQRLPENYEITYSTYVAYTAAELLVRQATIDSQMAQLDAAVAAGVPITQAQYDRAVQTFNDAAVATIRHNNSGCTWYPDADGNYDRANNSCLNGDLADVEGLSACAANAGTTTTKTLKAKKHKDHGWVPHLTASYEFTDQSRSYFKYAESLRYPSMFESTLGFSAYLNPNDVKPEHAYNWEVGYIHDLTQWLPNAEYADIKLTYYHNLTKDVIERDTNFVFNNVDEQKIRGIELDLRYDSGRFFTSLGMNYVLQNEICDEDSAARLSMNDLFRAINNPIPECFNYGFPGGYQLVQATPEFSANWSVGGRFLNRRLELGSRFTYYKAYENDDLDWYKDNAQGHGQRGYIYAFNTAYSWDNALIMDAYARYNIKDDLIVELSGSNLSDQYYVDPATRSAMAAPGRTLKVSLTAKF